MGEIHIDLGSTNALSIGTNDWEESTVVVLLYFFFIFFAKLYDSLFRKAVGVVSPSPCPTAFKKKCRTRARVNFSPLIHSCKSFQDMPRNKIFQLFDLFIEVFDTSFCFNYLYWKTDPRRLNISCFQAACKCYIHTNIAVSYVISMILCVLYGFKRVLINIMPIRSINKGCVAWT